MVKNDQWSLEYNDDNSVIMGQEIIVLFPISEISCQHKQESIPKTKVHLGL